MTLRDLIDTLPLGLDTPVLGELPMTADGAIVGIGCTVWHEDANWQTMRRPQFVEREIHYPINTLRTYSTREAALAARKGTA